MRRSAIGRLLVILGKTLLFLAVATCLAIVLVPSFLDAIYYRGPRSDHFDGQRFFNPDGEDTLRLPAGGSRSGFFVRYLTGSDDRPAWPDHVAVTPSRPLPRVDGPRMIATWIGHATVLVQTNGLNILTDPVWSDHAGPFGIGPKRVAEPGVRLENLPKIDLVLLSHDHYDHFDLATLNRLWARDRPLIVTSLGNDAILRAHGIEAVGRDWGGHLYNVDGKVSDQPPLFECPAGKKDCWFNAGVKYEVIVTRNHHWGSRWFADRDRALWSSFVVKVPGGNIFFAGDTGMGDGRWPAEAARHGPIRLALIPIGAFRFEPGQMGIGSHIGPIDAVRVFERLAAARAIGIHWGTFRLSYEAYDTPPKLLAEVMRCAGLPPGGLFDTARIGQPVEIAPYRSQPATRPMTPECLGSPAVKALR